MKTWEIRYYITESSLRCDTPAFKETIRGDRNYVANWAEQKIRNSQFKFYRMIEK